MAHPTQATTRLTPARHGLARVIAACRPGPSQPARRLSTRHALMLALAIEVLWLGVSHADRYRPQGITIEQTIAPGHVIT